MKQLLVLMFASVLMLGGCQIAEKHYGSPDPVRGWATELTDEYAKFELVAGERAGQNAMRTLQVRVRYENAKTDADKAVIRNRVISDLLIIGESYHESVDDQLHWVRASVDFGLDVTQLGLAVGGVAASSESTKELLAALTGGVKGVQASMNNRFFEEIATSAMLAEMHTRREAARRPLLLGKVQTVSDYSLDDALADGARFIISGNVTEAIRGLANRAGDAEKSEKEKTDHLKSKIASINRMTEQDGTLVRGADQDKVDALFKEACELTFNCPKEEPEKKPKGNLNPNPQAAPQDAENVQGDGDASPN